MGTVYKIHPAIGVARVGNHPTAYFVGPEVSGMSGMEIGTGGAETPIRHYKQEGKIKRQAARFRIFRYQEAADGQLQLLGEVTANDAQIEWRVNLVNRKAALDHNPAPSHPARPRNTDITDRESLVIRGSQPVVISGQNQSAREIRGQFLGTEVYLGEVRTDPGGRLLVLGGRGHSESVPPGEDLPEFANNDRWHDDVSDGPVTAVISLPGQEPIVAHHPAWVVVAPPDFAPGIDSIITLYDVAFQAAIEKGALRPDPVPSFRRHIKPLIERAAALRWVNSFNKWADLGTIDLSVLADTGPANAPARAKVAKRLQRPGLRDFIMPAFMSQYVNQWAAGQFISDLNDSDLQVPIPDQLDRAALDACVGNNFFPGIEASINLRDKDMYARPFRLDHTNVGKVYPGCLTEIMAVPWQADFRDCDGGVWWPSQRPDIAMTDPHNIPASQSPWEAPIPEGDHQGMVDHVLQLGFIVGTQINGQIVFLEVDRDPKFPREAQIAATEGGGSTSSA